MITIALFVALVAALKFGYINYQERLLLETEISISSNSHNLRELNSDLKRQRDDYKFHLERMSNEHEQRVIERDEARKVAEKFRDKYLSLKAREEVRIKRSDEHMNYVKLIRDSINGRR